MQYIKLMVAVGFWVSAQVWADVGMITQLNGEVSITTSGSTQAAAPFIKVNTGDKLTLVNAARLQMVYFGNGRQEIWKGGGQIEVGGLESKSALKPEVSQLPLVVVNQLARMSRARQQGNSGMVRMRSIDPCGLDKPYGDLKRRAEADDTTPEIYLLSGLVDCKDFKRAKSVLAEIEGKTEYKPVVEYFSPIVNAGGK